MPLHNDLPGRARLTIEHLLLDVNGTLTSRGELLVGVAARLGQLGRQVELHLLSADTFGSGAQVADQLGLEMVPLATGEDKRRYATHLGAEPAPPWATGRINDAPMLEQVALGIAVIGPEGASMRALQEADVVCRSIEEALDLLGDPLITTATLRP